MSRLLLIGSLVALAGCASPKLATPEELAAEEERILAPFMDAQTLVARSVRVEMTANFYDEFIASRVVKPAHEVIRKARPDGGTSYVYRALERQPVMLFQLGKTQIAAEEELTLEVLGGTHALTLSVDAQAVTLAKGGGQQNMRTLRIADGSFDRDGGP
ncbi:MAG: hypothetical protein ACYTG5_00335 [Planctomycetota bacterium]